jgi:voltage-gated potassium channel
MNTGYQLSPSKKLLISLSILLMLVIGGTVGFAVIERMNPLEGLYMTIITLSTVGFGEVRPLHVTGRIFVIVLIIFGVVAATFAVSALGQLILEGQLRSIMGRRKMKTKIEKLSGHYIIAGFGRVGRQVAETFLRRKVPFIVVERDNSAVNQLDSEGYLYVEGPATEDEALVRAGVERAKVLVSTLPEEADNVYLALTARHMNPSLHIISRADNPAGEKKLRRAGANYVVSPHILGGMRMAMASLRPNVVDFMQMTAIGEAGLGIEEVALPEGSRFCGKTLVESKIKADYGVTVIGIKKKDQRMQINPPPTAMMDDGDILVLVGSSEELEKFTAEMA